MLKGTPAPAPLVLPAPLPDDDEDLPTVLDGVGADAASVAVVSIAPEGMAHADLGPHAPPVS